MDSRKLFVGGLPFSSTQEELAEAFGKAGAVEEAIIIFDKMTGRSKGFGFVTMSSEDEAQQAIDMWHEQEFGGRTLTVNVARPKAA